jgi:hypothetical protein
MSTTRIAMSHKEEPRDLRLLKDACPGVSMISKPGSFSSTSANWMYKLTIRKFNATAHKLKKLSLKKTNNK